MAELSGRVAPEQMSKNSLELPWVNSGNDGELKVGETSEMSMLPSFLSAGSGSLGGTSCCWIGGEINVGETAELLMLPSFLSTATGSCGDTSCWWIGRETVGVSMDDGSNAGATGSIVPVAVASIFSQCVVFWC